MIELQKEKNDLAESVGPRRISAKHFHGGLESFDLTNGRGMRVRILNYGATIAGIEIPDRSGRTADVTLGHDNPMNHVGGRFYFGATVGRYANRIAGAKFTLDGKEYRVTANKNGNLLHGGDAGFDKKFWESRVVGSGEELSLQLALVSPDGDEGFPGRMEVRITYSVTSRNELRIQYAAATDQPTVVNLTNHSYFNLTGSPDVSIVDHLLSINADRFTPIGADSLPTGEMLDVADTPMDFRKFTKVGERIGEDYNQLVFAKGYDQNWVLRDYDGSVREAAALYEPSTGRIMEVLTDQPGIQFYSGNYLDGSTKGKEGIVYGRRSGLCLECQHFPNSPNEEAFPSTVLRPGEDYRQTTIYRFSADQGDQ